MLCDVIVVCHRWAHAPVIHAASHFYHVKRVAWVSVSMHICDPVPIVMGAGGPLQICMHFFYLILRINFICGS